MTSVTPTSTITSTNSSNKSNELKGQPLQGVWGTSRMTAAAMIKQNLSQSSLLPSRAVTPMSSTTGSRASSGSNTPQRYPSNTDLSFGEQHHPPQSKPFRAKSNQEFSRSRSGEGRHFEKQRSNDRREKGKGKYVHGGQEQGSGSYFRSVSDNSYAQERGRGGRRHNYRFAPNKHPSSEPSGHNKSRQGY